MSITGATIVSGVPFFDDLFASAVDPVAQWRAVEDAVRGMTDPSLASVREQLVDVLRTNYEALDE